MIRMIMKTYFYYSRKNKNKKGLAPIYCRIANGSERADFSTGIYIDESDWNAAHGMPKKKLIRETTALQRLQNDLISFIYICENENITYPLDILKKYKAKQKPQRKFLLEVAQEHYEKSIYSAETKEKIQNLIIDLKNHFDKIDIKQIDVKHLNNFRSYIQTKNLKSITINRKMRLFKNIMNYAEHQEYINKSPFNYYTSIKLENHKPITLTKQEIESIKHLELDKRLNNVRNLLLSQIQTGMSYVDLMLYSEENIIKINQREFYYSTRKKTGTEFYFPVTEEIKKLLISSTKISNQKYNRYLKEIAEKIGTEKQLTTHMARRTFAQLHINNGLSFESVAVMMGHSSTRMTEKHYSRAGIERLLNELNGYTGG